MTILGKKQQEILGYISREVKRKGYAPSVREIAQGVGLNSSSTVQEHLEKLEQMGFIRREPYMSRALVLLREA